MVVYPVTGNFNDAYYHTDTLRKITDEIDDQYDIEKDIYIVIVDVSTERIQGKLRHSILRWWARNGCGDWRLCSRGPGYRFDST